MKATTKSIPFSCSVWKDEDGTIQMAGGDLKIISVASGSKLYDALSDHIAANSLHVSQLEYLWFLALQMPKEFSLQEFYDRFMPMLEQHYPDNENMDATIRYRFQDLRDMGRLKFLDDNGNYRRVN